MKKIIITALVLLTIVISCNTGKHKNSILQKPDDIIADEYVINIDQDTTLVTKNGALLKIPKGSLSADNGAKVTLEIKEAYSLEQMMKAGLTTQANGELLSSGGMIYINAKGGQNVTIKQAIKVAIPSDYLRDSMQLFKGEKDNAGNINWASPKSLPVNKQLSAIQQGKQLFQMKCASCHAIGKDLSGPDLAHFPKRFPYGEENSGFYQHGFRNYNENVAYPNPDTATKKDSTGKDYTNMLAEDLGESNANYDSYFIYKCNLLQMYGTTGPILDIHPTYANNFIKIYSYIQNESNRRKLPLPKHDYLLKAADSCVKYKTTVNNLLQQKKLADQKKNNLVKKNGPSTVERQVSIPSNNTGGSNSVSPPPPARRPSFDNEVSPENNEAVYYQFSIETFGWYNNKRTIGT